MDDDDLDALIKANVYKKKNKRSSAAAGRAGVDGNSGGEHAADQNERRDGSHNDRRSEGHTHERRSERKKKSSKSSSSRTAAATSATVEGAVGTATSLLEERIRAKQAASFAAAAAGRDDDADDDNLKPSSSGGGSRRIKKKSKKEEALARLDARIAAKNAMASAAATATSIQAIGEEGFDAKNASAFRSLTGQNGGDGDDGGEGDVALMEKHFKRATHDRDDQEHGHNNNGTTNMAMAEVIDLQQNLDTNNNDASNGNGNNGSEEYCYPNVEADTEIMAEINQEGIVTIDESGGIQAYVAETIAIDGDNVGIIKSDAEIEKEEKKKYTKLFLGSICCLIVLIIAIAVPLTLKFAKGNEKLHVKVVTQEPTGVPSMVPSLMPSSMPSSVRFTEVMKKLDPLSGGQLKLQGSPQYRAAMWISDQDEMQLALEDPGFEQRYIMALFYYAMDGPNWVNDNGWLGPNSECFWFGIYGESDGCGSPSDGGCLARGDFKGDYDKICRLNMGECDHLINN